MSSYKRLEAGDKLPGELTPTNPPRESSPPAYSATVVTVPPSGVWNGAVEPPPNDYLVHSILTVLFCFMPLGIIALFKSLEVRNAIQRGDHATALVASRAARKFNKWSVIIGVIILVVVLVFTVAAQLAWIIPVVINSNNNDNNHA